MSGIGRLHHILILLLIATLAGCSTPVSTQESPIPEATLTPTVAPVVTEEVIEPEPEGPVTLRIWVPPEFDPAGETLAGAIFQSRLDEFVIRRPNVEIEVRSKDVDGYGGILDTLSTASVAAPLALPDLVALDRHSLETAAGMGVLYPYDGLTTVLDDPDWYDFARQLSFLQNATFGLPFAGDALVMTYRPDVIPEPPESWDSSLTITNTLSFPAADSSALFTQVQYHSLGASLVDENGQPFLDVVQLTGVFSYFQQASITELMPFWLTQFETDAQSWQAYEDSQADMAVTWISRYFATPLPDTLAAPIPTYDGVPITLADGWVWALTTNNPERQLLTAQLAEFLTTSEFIANWTAAAGFIPTRPSATAAWLNQPSQFLVSQVAPNARLISSLEIEVIIGPILQQATVSVLKAEADPNVAAESAVEKLNDLP